jgi:wyosine [tRNA(Phe)-imidazoG37] synthetase (radical SAM superfamily)
MRYVYAVVSRRAGGVSVGLNLNPNDACNWRCLYCQVPGLTRGGPPPLDLDLLERELGTLLDEVTLGDFLLRRGPEGARRLVDVAFSGNGEPTLAPEFPLAVALAERALRDRGLLPGVMLRLITNGSGLDREPVRAGLEHLGRAGGEAWFKVDVVGAEAMARVNGVSLAPELVERRLLACAERCRTWVQTCLFRLDGQAPAEGELAELLAFYARVGPRLAGVHLYGLARPSLQPEAPRLHRLEPAWLEAFGARVRALGLAVHVSP